MASDERAILGFFASRRGSPVRDYDARVRE
jgi:hypothetical protein